MSVYLVRQLTSPLLLQRLKMKGIRNPDHSRALSNSLLLSDLSCIVFVSPPRLTPPSLCVSVKEKLTADPDSEVATTSLRVSLMCPVSRSQCLH